MECNGILQRTMRPSIQTWATRSPGAKRGGGTVKPRSPNIITIESDGSNVWKLDEIAELIMAGQVRLFCFDSGVE